MEFFVIAEYFLCFLYAYCKIFVLPCQMIFYRKISFDTLLFMPLLVNAEGIFQNEETGYRLILEDDAELLSTEEKNKFCHKTIDKIVTVQPRTLHLLQSP